MTKTIIIIICCLFLVAYLFDLTSSKTKIPSVILLLLLGWIIKQISIFLELQIPDMTSILPILGTFGLILIVLEGSLELEFDKTKMPKIGKSFIVALFPMLILGFLLAFLFHYVGKYSYRDSLTNAIPFCVISSAIAITGVKNLSESTREFIVYESSLSDILGILFFNFFALNEIIYGHSFFKFGLEIIIMAIVSVIATVGLSLLLSLSKHHIKYVPIILFVILIYAISEVYHLPALIFVLFFGHFLGNTDKLKQFKILENIETTKLHQEVISFKSIVLEGTFLIKTSFFILFGYLIETAEILNTQTLLWSFGIVAGIFIIRFIFLKLTKLPINPFLFIAPRGLLTILLFLAIIPSQNISLVNKSLIIQVIILTSLVMMIGVMNKTIMNKYQIDSDTSNDI